MTKLKNLIIISYFMEAVVFADRTVITKNGPVKGVTVARGKMDIEAFLGIPYAEPPVGRLRFLKSVPKTSWTGVFDASHIAPTCIQNVTLDHYGEPNAENMTEDCLHLNLWVPYSKNFSELKPVLIFIHGGAFIVGSSNMKFYDGTKLSQFGDMIVATINYRIGAMGFFTAFVDEATGNAGLSDQVLATKWIWENARSFGGDPDKIVLMGSSAGAISVSALLMAPMMKHMVKRAILQSGSSALPFALYNNTELFKTSQRFATLAGCSNKTLTLRDDPDRVVKCLKRLPVEKIAAAEGLIKHPNPLSFYPLVGDEIVPKPGIHYLKEGNFKDLELLIGINKEEGSFLLTYSIPYYFGKYGISPLTKISKSFAHQIIQIMMDHLGQKKVKEVADFYIRTVKNGTSEKYTLAISTFVGDFLVNCASLYQAEVYSLRNPVYFYKFSHRASASYLAEWMKTTHLDEVQFIFGNPMYGYFTPEEEEFSRRVMARWVAFIKTGDPNIPGSVQWPTFKYDDPKYLEIDEEETIHSRPDNYRCEFWRERFQAIIDDAVKSNVRDGIP